MLKQGYAHCVRFAKPKQAPTVVVGGKREIKIVILIYCRIDEAKMKKKKHPKLSEEKVDEFGCLLFQSEFLAGPYRIYPGIHYEKNLKYFVKEVNRDGFLYPPVQDTWKWDPITDKKISKVPNTKRTANLHAPIPTHLIERTDGNDLPKDFRLNEGAMILRVLNVVYETTTQFCDWWWSGKIRIHKSNFDWLHPRDLESLFIEAFSSWAGWSEDAKLVFLNCCFNFSRSMAYEWDYERFAFLYTCVDGIWWLSNNNHNIGGHSPRGKVPHNERINAILDHFNLHQNRSIIESIVSVRNNLFHQGLWGSAILMSQKTDEEYKAMMYLHEIVRRCLLRIIGIDTSYVRSSWEGYLTRRMWNRVP
jgi:hypothetical protein